MLSFYFIFLSITLGILQYQIKDESDKLSADNFSYESLVKKFTWAQWDSIHQTLYYIHNRKPTRCLVEGEEDNVNTVKTSPTLSGLQFHDDLPHESVVRFNNSFFLMQSIILAEYTFESSAFIYNFWKLWNL